MRLIEIQELSGERDLGGKVRSCDASDSEPGTIPPDTVGFDVYDLVCPTTARDF
jgi:hypothetical protein